MVIFRKEISIGPLRRKRKAVSHPKKNLLQRFTSRRKPVVESNILLVAPFDAEKQRLGEALLRYVVGEEARFDDASSEGMVTMPLGERRNGTPPLLYSLRGFQENDAGAHENDAGASRALLGMSRHQTDAVDSLQFVVRLRMAASVCVVCLDLTVTPLNYDSLSEDLSQLRQTFGNRLVFAGINAETLKKWNPVSQRKRMQIWGNLVGPSLIECSLEAEGISAEGISKVLAAVNAVNSTSRGRKS